MSTPLLEVNNLTVEFNKKSNIFSKGEEGKITAVDDASFTVEDNNILGIVGESGSGKSTIAKAIMDLAPVSKGEILYKGKPLHGNTTDIQMIFQSSYSSLNPRMKLYEILQEPILINKLVKKSEIRDYLIETMKKIRLPESFLERYPRQLSGGQRQRIAIARALVTNPKLIIADEPTSALDVSIQAEILNLLTDLKNDLNVSMIFISHNLAVVKYMSDSVLVMKDGKIVEQGRSNEIFINPKSDYTQSLIDAIPKI